MDTATLIAAGAVVVALVVVVLFWRQLREQRRAHDAAVAALVETARVETEALRVRLEEFAAERASAGGLLITDAGHSGEMVPDRLVVSATLGGPLIRMAAVAHGLGRALSAETRNRIGFEMRRELRRARRTRRRETRAAWRQQRTGTAALKEGDAA